MGALYTNTTGSDNTANGRHALYFNITGTNNTANGMQALYNNTTGTNNTANGMHALYNNTTGAHNTANGRGALYFNTTGANNTAMGTDAGRSTNAFGSLTAVSNGVFLGYDTRALAVNDVNTIVIGSEARGLGSNTAVLGNSSITATRLQGQVGIGMDPTGAANVNGLLVRAGSAQSTNNLFEAQSSAGTVLSSIGSTGALTLNPFGTSAGNTNELRFAELAAGGTNYVGFKAPDALAANIIWTLPGADGSSGQVLSTNGSGTLSWSRQGLTESATLDFPSTGANTYSDLTITVTGAADGDVVSLGIPNGSMPAAAGTYTAWVSASNTVTIRVSNSSSGALDPASGTFKVLVTKF
jgi:hypothetical protein